MKISIHLSCLLTLGLIHSAVFGQKQANVWHFGDGHAVDFNSGEPVSLLGSQIFAVEGSASYCNRDGRLLFYTNGGGREPAISGQDGGGIWNRQNELMYDMQGIEGGGFSAVQSAVIIEVPGQDSVYYVFTMDETEWNIGASPAIVAAQPGGRGLSYFTVDMRLNAGLGGVVLADQRITTPSYEALCAIRHANERDFWLLIHQGSEGLGVYSVTPAGISLANSYSALGTSDGNIKASPNGALVVAQFDPNPYLLQFNTATGQLDNPVVLPGLSPRYEFSPNSRFLYELQSVAGTESVLRYDLQASNITASVTSIGSFSSLGGPIIPGQPQLGPDGRIYFLAVNIFTGTKYLNRINCPNVLTASLQLDLLNFTSDNPFFCLPNFSAWLFADEDATFVSLGPDTIDLCSTGGSLVLDALNPGASYLWSTGASSQRITVNTPGTYSVTVTTECGSGTDEVVVVSCAPESLVCNVFQYTGSRQEWIVPDGVDTILVKMWGAAGGGGPDPTNNAGGGGGFTEHSLPVIARETLFIVVGGGGAAAQGHDGGAGGWPNGGDGGSGNRVELGLNVGGGGGGGGRSEIIRGGNTLAIAGGGGGGAYNRSGGGGGGLAANFTMADNTFAVNGFGGTQTAGGAPANNSICGNPVQGTAGSSLQGGRGATDLGGNNNRTGGGGGGDGYFGGGGGSSHDDCFGTGSTGGGGSGFVCNTCPGLTATTVSAGFAGIPGNAQDPLLANFPGIATGSNNLAGGHGLVQICYQVCSPSTDSISISSCGPYTAPSGAELSISGMYTDTLVNEEGCDSILLINLTVIEAPTVTITGDTVVCSGQSRLLTATAVGGGGDLSYVWSNGASDAVISVVTAGIYAVTVSNACGNGNSEVSVTTANLPLVSILARDTLCQGTPTRLLTNAVDASSFRWSTGETTTDLLVTSGGQYAVTVTNACGSSSDSVRLVELPLPEVRIVGDTILCSGDSIRLTAIADNADSYLWVAGSGDSLTTNDSMISVSIGGLFTVTVANACGQALEEQVVTERSDCGEGCRYYFPGVFSPNNDGINDGFQPLTNCIVENFEMLIFNRWGELLYRSDDATGFWDGTFRGKNCPADVYIYQLNYKFLNQEPKLAAGDVSIIR